MAGKTCINCGEKTMFKDGKGGYLCTQCNTKVIPGGKQELKCCICEEGIVKNNKCQNCGAKYIKTVTKKI